MSASSLFMPAIAFAGSAFVIDRSAWGILVVIAFLIMAGGAILVALRQRSQSKNKTTEQRIGTAAGPGQKLSNGLITLSSAAILVIYAAGYHRTGSAAEKFDMLASRRRTAHIPAQILAPTPVTPAATIPPVAPAPVPLPAPKKSSRTTLPAASKSKPAPAAVDAPPTTPSALPPTATPTEAAPQTPAANVVKPDAHYRDGSFLGWGRSRHGDIQASVVVSGGKIISTSIVQCLTRYSCSWISELPGQAVSRQSADVDFVSGVTESSDAFSDAVSAALSQARE